MSIFLKAYLKHLLTLFILSTFARFSLFFGTFEKIPEKLVSAPSLSFEETEPVNITGARISSPVEKDLELLSSPLMISASLERTLPVALPYSPKSRAYLKYIEEHPGSPKLILVKLYLAKSLVESSDYGEALSVLGKFLDEYGSSSRAIEAVGLMSEIYAKHLRNFKEAKLVLRDFANLYPDKADKLEIFEKKVDAYREADSLRRFIETHPGAEESYEKLKKLSELYEKTLGDLRAALEVQNVLIAYTDGYPEEIDHRLKVIELYEGPLQEPEKALEEYEELIQKLDEKDPRAPEIYFSYAKALIETPATLEKGLSYLELIKDRYRGFSKYSEALKLLADLYAKTDPLKQVETLGMIDKYETELFLSSESEELMNSVIVMKKIRDIREIINRDPKSRRVPNFLFYIARLYDRELRDYEKARDTYHELLSLNPSFGLKAQAILRLGELYENELRNPDEARKIYRKYVTESYPENEDTAAWMQFRVAKVFEGQKDYDRAMEAYEKISIYYPESRWAAAGGREIQRIRKMLVEEERRRREEATLARLAAGRRTAEIVIGGLTREIMVGEREEAPIETALKTEEIILTEGSQPVVLSAKPQERQKQLEDIIENYPDHPQLARFLHMLGDLYYKAKDGEKAVRTYRRIVDEFPKYQKYIDVKLSLGRLYKEQGELEDASRMFREVLEESPRFQNMEGIMMELAAMYVERQEYIFALETYQEIIDRFPQDSENVKKAYFEKAMIKSRYTREYDDAISELEQFANRYFDHPNALDAMIEIGRIYEYAKAEFEEARNAYQAALDKYPNTDRRREIIEAIERCNQRINK